jgi:hypothetical protein
MVEAHVFELAGLKDELAKETQHYTDHHLNVRHRLRNIHEELVASFGEVKAWCLPFPTRNALVENYIDRFMEMVRAMLGTVWQLNDNFVVLAIEGILNMLCSTGCQELSRLHELAASSDAFITDDVPTEVQKVVGCLV